MACVRLREMGDSTNGIAMPEALIPSSREMVAAYLAAGSIGIVAHVLRVAGPMTSPPAPVPKAPPRRVRRKTRVNPAPVYYDLVEETPLGSEGPVEDDWHDTGVNACLLPDRSDPFLLTGSPITVGRSMRCDLQINGSAVSRQHCSISPVDDGWEVTDLGSTNGTWVNGERRTHCKLNGFDVLEIGRRRLVYVWSIIPLRMGTTAIAGVPSGDQSG